MDKSKLAQLDPKLREAYERVMNTQLPLETVQPSPAPVQPSPPPMQPQPLHQSPPPTGSNPVPMTSIKELKNEPTPTSQPPPTSQPSPKIEKKEETHSGIHSYTNLKEADSVVKKGIPIEAFTLAVIYYFLFMIFLLYYLRNAIPFSPFARLP